MSKESFLTLLKNEVKPALGCTEPAAVAWAVAKAAEYLNSKISKVAVCVSTNVFKNAKAVIIPNTQESGLHLAGALGVILRNPEKELQLFEDITVESLEKAHQFILENRIEVKLSSHEGFYIEAMVEGEAGWAKVYVSGGHTNMIKAEINGEVIYENKSFPESELVPCDTNITAYRIIDLIDFIETVPVEEISFLENGITMNIFMAEKGLELKPGLGLGGGLQKLLECGIISNDLVNKVRIAVAAACDARMAGLNSPIMSCMGSGNHGIEAIVPLAVVAKEIKAPGERVIRALALSHLVTAYVKQHTGKLTPICGCSVAAGVGVTAGITWLIGGNFEQIAGAIKNVIGNLTGMICDGAKGGCALKLSTSAAEAVTSAYLAVKGVIISPSDGIISAAVEDTIRNLGEISISGMSNADQTILKIMMEK